MKGKPNKVANDKAKCSARKKNAKIYTRHRPEWKRICVSRAKRKQESSQTENFWNAHTRHTQSVARRLPIGARVLCARIYTTLCCQTIQHHWLNSNSKTKSDREHIFRQFCAQLHALPKSSADMHTNKCTGKRDWLSLGSQRWSCESNNNKAHAEPAATKAAKMKFQSVV